MSEELPLHDNSARLLRAEEKALLSAMLSQQKKIPDVENRIALARVYDMSDGGMGSIKFVGSDENTLGENLAEASYFDDDGVQVIITVYGDEAGNLYEVDFWRVDFLPLKKYPQPDSLKLVG
ncbi:MULTISPECIES: DUF6984 family protein [Delftia]|uniref:DUF6984 family protein n=1 Tax=Delftia TaxID=80865 RepID=UPI000AD6D28B|nr:MULTISPECIES: hypothetical protein [Delftia]MDC2862973.1 hypothetical protein [Delftia sp. DT-2]MPT51087.1 hypothetical protein [Delftia sp.]